jgi:predicted dehydrogenase
LQRVFTLQFVIETLVSVEIYTNTQLAFCKDILCNPATRDVHDVKHTIVAAASSTSSARASSFLHDIKAPPTAKAYGSYHELVADPAIDVIYVATPHSHHFQNAMLALQAGKHVLCEKALTVNAAQARKLFETAKEKNLFFMEAVWTRYFPLSVKIRELVKGGEIGVVHRVFADLSIAEAKDDGSLSFPTSNRMVNPDLAGGALLDLGIYALTWVFQILYHCQARAPADREVPHVLAAVQKYDPTGVDEMTSMILQFPQNKSMGIATTGMRVATQPDKHGEASEAEAPSIRIQGTKGEIQVFGPAYRPLRYRVLKNANREGEFETVDCPIPKDAERDGWGHGMAWEADEVGRCLKEGKLESEGLDWRESAVIMDVMDEVRKQGGLKYSDLIETDVFDKNSPLNGKA